MAELQKLTNDNELLYQQWTQYLLEQSTLASYNRVDKLARSKIGMRLPENNDVTIINLNV